MDIKNIEINSRLVYVGLTQSHPN